MERQIIKKLYESNREKTPNELYEEYLIKHRQGVVDVYHNVIEPILRDEGVESAILDKIEELIYDHDASKFSDAEWDAYRDYFYDKENHPRSSEAFNHAWKHHQNHNPHHWNYWVLINDVDEPQVQALDMPFEYVIEMLCDWQSAGNHYGNTAYDWYNKNGNRMILSDNTRKIIEKYIGYLK